MPPPLGGSYILHVDANVRLDADFKLNRDQEGSDKELSVRYSEAGAQSRVNVLGEPAIAFPFFDCGLLKIALTRLRFFLPRI